MVSTDFEPPLTNSVIAIYSHNMQEWTHFIKGISVFECLKSKIAPAGLPPGALTREAPEQN